MTAPRHPAPILLIQEATVVGPCTQIASFKRRIAAFASEHGSTYTVLRDEPNCCQITQLTSSANPPVVSAGTAPCVWTDDLVCRLRAMTPGACELFESHSCQQKVVYNCRLWRDAGWDAGIGALVDDEDTELVFEYGRTILWEAARGRFQIAA